MNVDLSELKAVPQQKWDELANKKIYFGHQSVGYNIIVGVKDVMAQAPNIKLNIVETKNPADIEKPGFYHSGVGQNRYPYSKIDDFKRIIESGVEDKVDIAFFKFCYVDIVNDTDIDKIFKYYGDTFEYLAKKFPRVKFVHSTVPLTTIQSGLKAKIKKIIGKKIDGVEDNTKRNLFNQMLLQKYGSNVFDLAKSEATYPDGAVQEFENNNKKYYSLIQQYTTDGGHLDGTGNGKIGMELLKFLAELK